MHLLCQDYRKTENNVLKSEQGRDFKKEVFLSFHLLSFRSQVCDTILKFLFRYADTCRKSNTALADTLVYPCAQGQLASRNEKQSYKSAGVVVPQSLGVAEGLQQRVGLQDDVFDVLRGNRGNELLAASLADCKTRYRTLHTDPQPGLDILYSPSCLDSVLGIV